MTIGEYYVGRDNFIQTIHLYTIYSRYYWITKKMDAVQCRYQVILCNAHYSGNKTQIETKQNQCEINATLIIVFRYIFETLFILL